jgi:hypothetical protein
MLREQVPAGKDEQQSASPRPAAGQGARLLISLWNMLLARRGMLAALPALAAVGLLFCGASWQIFWIHTDAARYQCYALAFWQGSQGIHLLPENQCAFLYQFGVARSNVPPFHILPFEYPPLTLTLFSPALVVPLIFYQIAFALLMALAVMLIYWLLQRYGPRGAGLACAFYLVVGAWATAEGRFDLVPAGLTLLCLIAAEHRRWSLAYIALALAFLLKIYPLLLLPALFMAEQIAGGRFHRPSAPLTVRRLPGEIWQTLRGAGSWRWTHALLFLGVAGTISGLFALLNFQGAVVSQLSYFANRPVQVEATGSTLLWLATFFGHPATVVYTFGSINIESDLGNLVALACEACFLLGYLLVILWQWRGKLDLAQAFIAGILVFVVTGKVFSPQYLIWLIPLLAYNGAFSRLWLLLWTPLSLLTTAVYPYLYMQARSATLAPYVPGFIECVAIRNLLLVVITLAFLFNWWNLRQRMPPALADTSALPRPHPV